MKKVLKKTKLSNLEVKPPFLFFVALFCSFGFSCSQTDIRIFSVQNGVIMPDNSFIGEIYDTKRSDSLTYDASNATPINLRVGNVSYTAKSVSFFGWDDEPGYNVIEISRNNDVVFVHKQVFPIIDFDDYRSDGTRNTLYATTLRPFSDNKYFIKAPLSNEATALIYAGWPYGTEPAPQLLIIVVTPTDVKIVFNQKMNIDSVTQSDYEFSMATRSELWLENKALIPSHTTYQQNGVLYLKNN